MNLVVIRDWFKTVAPGLNAYVIGKANGSIDQTIRFKRAAVVSPKPSIGGMANTSYASFAVNTVLHWTNDAAETDSKAEEIKEMLLQLTHPVIGTQKIVHLNVRNVVPIDVDENGVYEVAIDFELIYQR